MNIIKKSFLETENTEKLLLQEILTVKSYIKRLDTRLDKIEKYMLGKYGHQYQYNNIKKI